MLDTLQTYYSRDYTGIYNELTYSYLVRPTNVVTYACITVHHMQCVAFIAVLQ